MTNALAIGFEVKGISSKADGLPGLPDGFDDQLRCVPAFCLLRIASPFANPGTSYSRSLSGIDQALIFSWILTVKSFNLGL
jgi:hypothetical protein